MKKRIKAVIFDVGGVLALGENSNIVGKKIISAGVHSDIAKRLGISIDQYFDSIDTDYAFSIEGKIPYEKSLKILSNNLNISEEKLKKLYIWAYKKHFKQNNLLFKQAFKLKKLGYKIAVLSDQWYLSRKVVMPNNIYKKFNEIIVSYEVGMRKPSKKIYLLALNKLNMHPHEVLFIDNQKWNINPARKLGMNTILFKSNKQLFKEKTWRNLFKDEF